MSSNSLPSGMPVRSLPAARVGFIVAAGVLTGTLCVCALPGPDSRNPAEAVTLGDVGWNVASPGSAA